MFEQLQEEYQVENLDNPNDNFTENHYKMPVSSFFKLQKIHEFLCSQVNIEKFIISAQTSGPQNRLTESWPVVYNIIFF